MTKPWPEPIDVVDPSVRRAIRRAEKADGFQYGPRFRREDDGSVAQTFVHLTFYPKRKWLLRTADGEDAPLTRDAYAALFALKL